MSLKKVLPASNYKTVTGEVNTTNHGRFVHYCLSSSREISIDPVSSLKDLDPDKLKSEIKKWAKSVAAYSQAQVSG